MSPLNQVRKTIWRCSCFICNLVNLMLALLALGLSGLLTLNYLGKPIPVPDGMASWIIHKSSPDNLKLTWSRALFDLHAGIFLSDFKLTNTDTEQIILKAGETYLKWSPLHLVIPGLPAIQEIDIRNLQIFVPVSHSPSGLNEPVISLNHVYSRIQKGQLFIDSLLLQTGGVRMYLDGEAPIAALLGSSMPATDPRSMMAPAQNLYPLLQKLARIPQDFNADLNINWQVLPTSEHLFRASGSLAEFTYENIRMQQIYGNAIFTVSGNQMVLRNTSLSGILYYLDDLPEVPFLNIPESAVPIPFRLSADGDPVNVSGHRIPSMARLSLSPDDPNIKFQQLIIFTDMSRQSHNPSFDWIVMGPSAFASGRAYSGKPANPLPAISKPDVFDFRAYLPNCSIYQFLSAPLPNRLLVGSKADFIRLNGSFELGNLNLQGIAVCDGLNIGQTDFQLLFANLLLNRQNLVLDNIQVHKSSNEHAAGSYSQHFPSSRFSLNADGFISPSSLDSILGDWWIDIFTHIRTDTPLPGDVTVWGLWRQLDSLRSVTEVHGEGVRYRGVRIPRLELRVRSNNKWAYLDVLKGSFPSGELTGRIGIRSGLSDTDRYRAYVLDLTSTAPWKAVLGATGLEPLKILDFEGGNPYVSVEGILWRDSGKGFDSGNSAKLNLRLFQQEGFCHFRTLRLAGLSASGHVSDNNLLVDGLSGQFADGIFTGNLAISNWQEQQRMRKQLDIDLINASYGIALDQLTRFAGLDSAATQEKQDLETGRLDAELLLKFGEDIKTYSGSGNISVREGKLGTVHMFGELSRLLEGMGLGFTSVEMDTLSLDWNLTGPALEIRNGTVTGPALNLTLDGWVDLETSGLQMKSDLTLFSGLFSKMLTPVSDTLQLSLVGTLQDPDWRVRFNPFGWAINRLGAPREPEAE